MTLLQVMVMAVSLASLPILAYNFTQCSEVCRVGAGFIYDSCCYVPVVTMKMSWQEARQHCKSLGGSFADLAVPLSPFGIAYEIDSKLPAGHRMWVGASTNAGKTKWVTGAGVSCIHYEDYPQNGDCAVREVPSEDAGILSLYRLKAEPCEKN